ncbi:microfibril-associated glycoprotein 4 isoform X1 [Danio rerio]|uniref:Microfibril associated protein 4 n=2 Tax=Danio rerio TaxID=7955 RepID=A0A8M1PI90_DANRE|nr:microfibril-associated glycoprotein 4 precursor [Danio rerio]NP_998054.2 microfibril-associated glycoprotein 4 precursor [Danio rerio]|eukprot:NP_001315274.1 microfibrillar-associated protein 4 precursor [Danio rerio]
MAIVLFLATLLSAALASDCTSMPFDCSDIYKSGETLSGVYTIYPAGETPVWVYCQMLSDGKDEENGGWTVIQRRMDGSVNFYRPWRDYKRGFGNVEGEYWLGLENLYQLTRHKKFMLRVDLEDFEGRRGFAQYSSFSVGCECEGYKLQVSGFTDGGAGDSLSGHNGVKFSTFDKDQDTYDKNCAKEFLGAFWYGSCHTTNPNAVYLWGEDATHHAIGVCWYTWKGTHTVSMKIISMKIKQMP